MLLRRQLTDNVYGDREGRLALHRAEMSDWTDVWYVTEGHSLVWN